MKGIIHKFKELILKNKVISKKIILIMRIFTICILCTLFNATMYNENSTVTIIMREVEFGSSSYFSSLNHLKSDSLSGLMSAMIILPIIFLGTYYSVVNYINGLQRFVFSRCKKYMDRRTKRVIFVKEDIINDILILIIGIMASIILNGIAIDNLEIFIITTFKIIIMYLSFVIFPILLSDTIKGYIFNVLFWYIISVLLLNIVTTISFLVIYLALVIIMVFTIIYKDRNGDI